jgi:hypothetical protein
VADDARTRTCESRSGQPDPAVREEDHPPGQADPDDAAVREAARGVHARGRLEGRQLDVDHIYLSGVDVAQKDPTLQALGLNGQIYGSRLDLILLDDLVTCKNVHTYKELADFVGTEVASRVDENGELIVLGTRMGANDLYSELRDKVEWDGETPVWTWFAQPAVLEEPCPRPDHVGDAVADEAGRTAPRCGTARRWPGPARRSASSAGS